MAADLDDGEFWLPSEFLVEDALLEKKSWGEENERRACFPYKFGSFGSDLSSPVESVVSSTETESDEEEFLAGLTWQMAHTMLQGDEERAAHFDGEKTKRVMAGSPQSTLCAVGSLYGYSHGSSRSSPNGPSQVSSPPSTPMNPKEDAWDLLYEAAGQVVRMKMNEESQGSHGRGLLGSPLVPPQTNPYMSQSLSQQQLQNKQFQQLKQQQQQLMKQQPGVWGKPNKVNLATQQQQILNRGRSVTPGYGNVKCARPLGLSSSAWPPLQKQNQTGSGMRAVFLAGSGARRESTGTGVFLPRRAGNPTDFRKKPACSTVLLPARVVQALNLNIDEMGTAHTRYHGNFVHHDDAMVGRTNGLIPQQQQMQQRDHIPFRPLQPPINQELRLPPEWTY